MKRGSDCQRTEVELDDSLQVICCEIVYKLFVVMYMLNVHINVTLGIYTTERVQLVVMLSIIPVLRVSTFMQLDYNRLSEIKEPNKKQKCIVLRTPMHEEYTDI